MCLPVIVTQTSEFLSEELGGVIVATQSQRSSYPEFPPSHPSWTNTGVFIGNPNLLSMHTQATIDYDQSLLDVDETKVAIISYGHLDK